ncbi:MAG: hypothetical protein E6I91_03460 [Chloroflexi bacterium]|nr:MAG: hypothetical protein E6I91_03460 [Chloroflexota bacterium]
MNLPDIEGKSASAGVVSSEAHTRLSGSRLILAQVAWVFVVTLLVALFLAMLPPYYTLLQTVCTGAPCGLAQPTPDSALAIQRLGLSIGTYATIPLALTMASAFLCLAVGAVIFWRKSGDWMALLVALGVVAIGTVNVTSVLQESSSPWQVLAIVLNILGNGVFFLVFSLFPTGRFAPGWTRWLFPCWVVSGLVFLFTRDVFFSYLVHTLVWLAVVILLVIVLFYRYHFASSPLQRQQTKWVIFGSCVAGLISVGFIVPTVLFPSLGQAGSFYQLITTPTYILVVLIIPICLGLAILRYRLYDIDLLINRTLVYGTLTVVLALVYVGFVIGLQSLVHLFTGQLGQAPVVIVVSTLAIAALFQPLRQRIQAIIDRRFYRRKYDAAKTLAAFSATLRQEVDLDQLRGQLLAVVQETMQPIHVSLWLRTTAPDRKPQETWSETPSAP